MGIALPIASHDHDTGNCGGHEIGKCAGEDGSEPELGKLGHPSRRERPYPAYLHGYGRDIGESAEGKRCHDDRLGEQEAILDRSG